MPESRFSNPQFTEQPLTTGVIGTFLVTGVIRRIGLFSRPTRIHGETRVVGSFRQRQMTSTADVLQKTGLNRLPGTFVSIASIWMRLSEEDT